MPQQENLSNQNAFVRLACGAGMTAFGIAKLSRKPDCMRGKAMIILGAMKMAEGILKFCPTKAIMNSSIASIISELQTSNSNSSNSSKAGSGLGAAASAAMGGFGSSSNTGSKASGSGTNPISDVAQLMKDFASTSTAGAQQNKQNNQSSNSNQQTSSTQPFNLNQQTDKQQTNKQTSNANQQANSSQQTNKQQSNTTQPSKS